MNVGLMSAVLAALSLTLTHRALWSQIAIGARYGEAWGTANYRVGEVHVRARAVGQIHLTAAFEVIGGTWGCVDSALDAIRCGYDGYTVSVGSAFAVFDEPDGYLALGGSLGAFTRNSSYAGREYKGDRHLSGRLGLDFEATLIAPVRIQGGVGHRRIFDSTYETAVGQEPHFTSFTAGLSLVL